MKLQEALNASPVDTAEIEIGSLTYVVDGSEGIGTYSVMSGVTGMPISDFQDVQSLDEAIAAVEKRGLPLDGWTPVEEDV